MNYINIENIDTENIFKLENYLKYENINVPDVYETYLLSAIKDLPFKGSYVVGKEEISPDYLSKSIYGTEDLWWVIMLYNDIISPKDIKIGQVIKFFDKNEFEWLFYDLITKQNKLNMNR